MLIVSLDNFDFTSNFDLQQPNNIGPGLGAVGPTCNWHGFSILSKLVLMFDMLAGRLELFPMLVVIFAINLEKNIKALKKNMCLDDGNTHGYYSEIYAAQ